MVRLEKLNVGVIGAGGHGKSRHLLPYSKLADVRLAAVADIDPKRREEAARTFKLKAYDDYAEMLDRESLDAVSVVTPTGMHSEVASYVLHRGVHVLVDKPLGASLQEALGVARAGKQSGKKLMVGFWSRFSPALAFGREYAERGLLGNAYTAYGYIVRRRGIPGIPTFIDKKLSGGRGVMLDIGCYALDSALCLLGFRKPVSVSGATYTAFGKNPDEVKFNWGNYDPSKFELEDYATAFVRFEGGATLLIEAGWAANVSHVGELGRLRILGDRGGLEATGDEALREISFHSRTDNALTDTKPILRELDLGYEMVRAFVKCIRDDSSPVVSAEQSILLHSVIDGIYLSAEKGEEVKIEQVQI